MQSRVQPPTGDCANRVRMRRPAPSNRLHHFNSSIAALRVLGMPRSSLAICSLFTAHIDGCAAAAEATAAATAAALTAAGVSERGSRVRQQQGVGVATVRVAKRVALVVEGERA